MKVYSRVSVYGRLPAWTCNNLDPVQGVAARYRTDPLYHWSMATCLDDYKSIAQRKRDAGLL